MNSQKLSDLQKNFEEKTKELEKLLNNLKANIDELDSLQKTLMKSIAVHRDKFTHDLDKIKKSSQLSIIQFHNRFSELCNWMERNPDVISNSGDRISKQKQLFGYSTEFQISFDKFNAIVTNIQKDVSQINESSKKINKSLEDITPRLLNSDQIFTEHEETFEKLDKDGWKLVQSRQEGILNLESELLELQQIYLQLSDTIKKQGDLVILITERIEKSHQEMAKGNIDLKQAYKYNAKARKKKVAIAALAVAGLVSAGVSAGAKFTGLFAF